jgi:RNA polymerase sigma-70 factor (ECF subfamily)
LTAYGLPDGVSARNPEAAAGHEPEEVENDDLLWWSARSGDSEAFAMLFERHAKAIYNYCFRRVGDWSMAEDLLSVVFLEAWRRRDKELPPGKVLPWLYGIATNAVRNRRRSERRYRAALARVPAARPESDFGEDVAVRLDDERQMNDALALLKRLTRGQRDAFALCAWGDLSYEDAAFALDLPVGTIRSRLSRARRALKELEATGGHEPGDKPNVQEGYEG